MKRWTIVMALALAIGLISAPVGVYADSHEAGEETSDSGGDGGGGACGGGDASHEGSH